MRKWGKGCKHETDVKDNNEKREGGTQEYERGSKEKMAAMD